MESRTEKSYRLADTQPDPEWAVFEILEGDKVVRRVGVPRRPLDIPGRD